jgi:hypothetical protein
MTDNAAAEMARKRAESLTPEERARIASDAAAARWGKARGDREYRIYTYFIRFGKYLKIGSSESPMNRDVQSTKKPADVNLGEFQMIGCLPSDEFPEKNALASFAYAKVDGCREWFHWTDPVESKILTLGLLDPPSRLVSRASRANMERAAIARLYGWAVAREVSDFARDAVVRHKKQLADQRIAKRHSKLAQA